MFIQKMNYIHYKPVDPGVCTYPEKYKYLSAKFYETGINEFAFLDIG